MSARNIRSLVLRAGVPVGLVVSALLVWQTSTAAFTAKTENTSNSWAAGTVALTDDDGGTALFTAGNLTPGATGQRCIVVTYNGSVTAGVRLYVKGVTSGTPDLAPYVQMTVEEGTGGTFGGGCSGFTASSSIVTANTPLSTMAATRRDYATGAGTWVPTAAGQTRSYRFSYRLDPATPDAAQGGSVTAAFTWEAQTP